MIYYVVLVGKDGFTREEERFLKDEHIPSAMQLRVHDKISRILDFSDRARADDRRFFLITKFYAVGKNFLVYREV